MGKRVFLAGLWHETNTFCSVETGRAEIASCVDLKGDDLLGLAGSNTEIGGMIDAGRELGFDLLPGRFAGAFPSKPMRAALFEEFVDDLLARARAAGPLDGALIVLHGAMVAEGADEADAFLIGRLRKLLGPDIPIVCTFDYHANLSAPLVEAADILVGYRTNPHVDMGARGREAAQLMSQLLGGARYHKAFRKLPMVSVSQSQVTADAPMRQMMAQLEVERAGPGINAASLAVGYPYADIGNLGMSTLVYGESADAAEAAAGRLAEALWASRAAFRADVVEPAAAAAQAIAIAETARPVILVDVADNVGGGSPGDGTVLLAALLEQKAPSAAVVITDPDAARIAAALGVGNRFRGLVGGKTDRSHGRPVAIDGIVQAAREVSYIRDEEWMTGQVSHQGLTARVSVGGVDVILTEFRTLPYDRRHLREIGVEPAETGVLVAKAAAGWRTPFEKMMAQAIYCDTPGANAPNLAHFPYTRRPKPLYPLEPDAQWTP